MIIWQNPLHWWESVFILNMNDRAVHQQWYNQQKRVIHLCLHLAMSSCLVNSSPFLHPASSWLPRLPPCRCIILNATQHISIDSLPVHLTRQHWQSAQPWFYFRRSYSLSIHVIWRSLHLIAAMEYKMSTPWHQHHTLPIIYDTRPKYQRILPGITLMCHTHVAYIWYQAIVTEDASILAKPPHTCFELR